MTNMEERLHVFLCTTPAYLATYLSVLHALHILEEELSVPTREQGEPVQITGALPSGTESMARPCCIRGVSKRFGEWYQ
jgi:hypothetical protein